MILLTELATKLETILNSADNPITGPGGYFFRVATEGFHIDSIHDKENHRNFIPVFIGSMGGTHNPVKDIQQANQTVSVVLYYPVRFKNDFYDLYHYLVSVFVGTTQNYGVVSGTAISNMSVPQYGELQDLDLQQLSKWSEETYGIATEVMQPYMSMQFTLYFSTARDDLVWGNEVTATISATIGENIFMDVPIVFDDGSLQNNSQTQSEQELGTNESLGLPFGAANGASFRFYILKDTTENQGFYTTLLRAWFNNTLQELKFDLSVEIAGATFTRTCFISSVNIPIIKGQPITATATFSPRIADEEEEEEGE